MTIEKWNVIGVIFTIVSFVVGCLDFAYKGLKSWRNVDDVPGFRIKWGKFEFFFGITVSILAVIWVLGYIFISLAGDDRIVIPPDPTPTVSTMPTESPALESNGVYVSNLVYHGASYSGYINDSREPDGEGMMRYLDGSEYSGSWVNGVREGYGTMKYDNGVYEGEWKNGKKNGQGTYTWSDGRRYEGAYADDVRSGKGVFFGWVDLTNGYRGTYYGESRDDHFNGSGYFLFDNGDKFEGTYENDFYWIGTYTRKDGSSFEVINGEPQ